MTLVRRLSVYERKKEIMDSARKVILEKGLEKATMEDIISRTTLSKGGVYHYYKNVFEIFRDIMIFGIEYRNEIINKNLKELNKGYEKEFIAKQIADKIIDDNPYMPLYVELLRNKKRNQKLIELMIELQEMTKKRMNEDFGNLFGNFLDEDKFQFLTDFINAMIMASDLLDAREIFKQNRKILEEMIILIFNK